MDNVRQMVVIPASSEQVNSDRRNVASNTDHTPKRSHKANFKKFGLLTKIVLKLANVRAYDELGRIKNENGELVANSDIGNLLEHSFKTGKALVGETEFIKLLRKANVQPEDITNENVKMKLLAEYAAGTPSASPQMPAFTPDQPQSSPQSPPPVPQTPPPAPQTPPQPPLLPPQQPPIETNSMPDAPVDFSTSKRADVIHAPVWYPPTETPSLEKRPKPYDRPVKRNGLKRKRKPPANWEFIE